jgi:hypothetical protein
MKDKLKMVWLSLLCLSVAAGVHAAPVNWDVVPVSAEYKISENGAIFWFPTAPPGGLSNYGTKQTSTEIINPAEDKNDEGFGGYAGEATFYTMGGGEIAPNGIVNKVAAEVSHNLPKPGNYISDGGQLVQSVITRNFSADLGAQVSVETDITGLINWADQNYDWDINAAILPDESYFGSQITAMISFLPLDFENQVMAAEIPQPITLDKDSLTGSTSFTADVDPTLGYYAMTASITIETVLANLDSSNGPLLGDLPNLGQIGEDGNPLLMTTMVNQNAVPIPGSLVLLFSGFLGLVVLRKRRLGGM